MLAIDCGIDIGSTNIKVVFVGEGGEVLWTLSQPSPRTNDGIGPVTNPLALVETLEGMIIQGWRELRLGQPLRSITTTGVGEDGCCVDATLQPLGPAIPWFDRRAVDEAHSLFGHHHYIGRTGARIDETRTAAKWLWLHRHRPAELHEAANWLALTDFPSAWWTGKLFMSSTLAPRTGCFDVHNRNWIPELLSATYAPALPPILNAGTIVGGVRQGPLRHVGAASAETIVVAGGHDHPIAASLIRRLDALARIDSLGTANLVYGETARFEDPALAHLLAFSVPPAAAGFSCLGVLEFSAALNGLASERDLRAYLSQTHLPDSPPHSVHELRPAPGYFGVSLRRTLENLSLMARTLFSLFDRAGVPEGRIYSTGGWSRSRSLVELRASVFGQPVVALGDVEMTALGAAYYGAEATGGNVVLPVALTNASVVDPFPAWSSAYQAIAESQN